MKDRQESTGVRDSGRFFYVLKEGEPVEFDVRITETRQKTVSVEASSMTEAAMIAQKLYTDNVFNLDATRHKKVSFNTLYPDFDRSESR